MEPTSTPEVKYTEQESKKIGYILSRLLRAQIDRDQSHPEFNNLTYIAWTDENEKIANTFIDSKLKKDDGPNLLS